MFRNDLLRNKGVVEFLEPLLKEMTLKDRHQRPTAAEALEKLDRISASLSRFQLLLRVHDERTLPITRWILDSLTLSRAMRRKLFGQPALRI